MMRIVAVIFGIVLIVLVVQDALVQWPSR